MRIEDEHTDVLQNIECMVASIYRGHTEMTDYNVMRTYEALIDLYTAELLWLFWDSILFLRSATFKGGTYGGWILRGDGFKMRLVDRVWAG